MFSPASSRLLHLARGEVRRPVDVLGELTERLAQHVRAGEDLVAGIAPGPGAALQHRDRRCSRAAGAGPLPPGPGPPCRRHRPRSARRGADQSGRAQLDVTEREGDAQQYVAGAGMHAGVAHIDDGDLPAAPSAARCSASTVISGKAAPGAGVRAFGRGDGHGATPAHEWACCRKGMDGRVRRRRARAPTPGRSARRRPRGTDGTGAA